MKTVAENPRQTAAFLISGQYAGFACLYMTFVMSKRPQKQATYEQELFVYGSGHTINQ